MTRFVENRSGIASLGKSDDMQDEMLKAAQAAAEYARSIAPVRTGAYKASIRAERIPGTGAAQVVSDDPGAIAIERGDDNTREGFHVLSRTADWIESS